MTEYLKSELIARLALGSIHRYGCPLYRYSGPASVDVAKAARRDSFAVAVLRATALEGRIIVVKETSLLRLRVVAYACGTVDIDLDKDRLEVMRPVISMILASNRRSPRHRSSLKVNILKTLGRVFEVRHGTEIKVTVLIYD